MAKASTDSNSRTALEETKDIKVDINSPKEVAKVARTTTKVTTRVEAKRVVRPAEAKAKAKERRLFKLSSKAIVVIVKSGATSALTALHVKNKQEVLMP